MSGSAAREPRLILIEQPGRAPVYYITWYDGKQRKRCTTGHSERAPADKIFARWLLDRQDRQDGLAPSPRYPHEVAIVELLDAFAENRSAKIRFPERVNYAIMRLAAWWGDRRVDAVCPVSCEAYCDDRLKAGIKLATITRELSVLRAALKWGQKNGRLISIPAVETPPRQDVKDRWLTRPEAARLLRAARAEPKSRLHLPLFILLALYMAARSEAILSLKWTQIDLVAGHVDFNPADRARTKKGRANNPIPPQLRWFLEKAHARATSPYVLSYQGEPIKRIVKGFRAACRRAGLDEVTPHTLRHTCATWQAQAGVPLHEIGGWLGHTDPRTTMMYAHHHPDHKKASLATFSRHREQGRNA
jgi:integrase